MSTPDRDTDDRPHAPQPALGEKVRGIALLGNVCVGKTSLFDHLCAGGSHAANVPGSTFTVDTGVLARGPAGAPRALRKECNACFGGGRRGKPRCGGRSGCGIGGADLIVDIGRGRPEPHEARVTHLYDTPGSSTLAAGSEDEMAARDLLLSGLVDGVVMVADSKNLRRTLALTLEVAELGIPMVVAANMVDEAEDKGLDLDVDELSRILGVEVVKTVAVEGRGVPRLADALTRTTPATRLVSFSTPVEAGLNRIAAIVANPVIAPRALAILLARGDRGAAAWVANNLGKPVLVRCQEVVAGIQAELRSPVEQLIAEAFYNHAERIADRVVTRTRRGPSPLVRFGSLAQRPWPGTAIALAVLVLAYYWVGAFGATFVVDALDQHVFADFMVPLCHDLVDPIPSQLARDAFMDPDFGILPTAVFLVFGLVLPVLFCFYLFLAILEDSGYLPRLALLSDRVFRAFGLNGLGLIPLVLGFSCVTMAIISTRMLPSRRDRIILTLLVAGVPCAPLLAVMVVILAKLPWFATAVVFAIIALRILMLGSVASKLVAGKRSELILEIPQMRVPRAGIILTKTLRRCGEFVREALPIFVIAALLIFAFDRAGGLAAIEAAAHPITNGLLGLPDQAVQVFIKTIIRRESGAAELSHLAAGFTNLQLVVTLLVMTFLFPCINALFVMIKERGLKVSAAILATVMTVSLLTGAAVNAICHALGVTFG